MIVFVNQDIRLRASITGEDGTAANPEGVRFIVKPPSGATNQYALGVDSEVSELEAGTLYALDISTDLAGRYDVRCESLDVNGAIVAVSETSLLAQRSRVL